MGFSLPSSPLAYFPAGGSAAPGPSSGTQRLYLGASAGKGALTAGCNGPYLNETAVNKVNYWTLDFLKAAKSYAIWGPFWLPNNYDPTTPIIARFLWTLTGQAIGSFTVQWGIQLLELATAWALDTAWGAAQEISALEQDANDRSIISQDTAGITPGGSLAGTRPLFMRVYRDPLSAYDTVTVTARLLAVQLDYRGL